jgi:Flp pilus assembly protein TadD
MDSNAAATLEKVMELSTRLIREQKYYPALQGLLHAYTAFGPRPEICLGLGTASLFLGKFGPAFELLAEAHCQAPEDASIMVNWAYAAEKAGRLPELQPELEKALFLHPRDPDLQEFAAHLPART